ncbi:MAG: hypothetical protein AAB647_03140, partial [Patescibacteria group bacterium]
MLQTDKQWYSAGEWFEKPKIVATLTNYGSKSLTIPGGSGFCGGPIEFMVNDKSVNDQKVECPNLANQDVVLAPGESVEETWDQFHLTVEGKAQQVTPGVYQAVTTFDPKLSVSFVIAQPVQLPTTPVVMAPPSPTSCPAPVVISNLTIGTDQCTYDAGVPVKISIGTRVSNPYRYGIKIDGVTVWKDLLLEPNRPDEILPWDQTLNGKAVSADSYQIELVEFANATAPAVTRAIAIVKLNPPEKAVMVEPTDPNTISDSTGTKTDNTQVTGAILSALTTDQSNYPSGDAKVTFTFVNLEADDITVNHESGEITGCYSRGITIKKDGQSIQLPDALCPLEAMSLRPERIIPTKPSEGFTATWNGLIQDPNNQE